MNRRGFLGSILIAAVAPAIVRAEIIMPVRKIASIDEATWAWWRNTGQGSEPVTFTKQELEEVMGRAVDWTWKQNKEIFVSDYTACLLYGRNT